MPSLDLTVAGITGLKCQPGKKSVDYRDEGCRGLELRVWSNGSRTWRADFTTKAGLRRRMTLGPYAAGQKDGGLTLKAAREKLRDLQRDVRDGADPVADARAHREADTFKQIAELWLEAKAKQGRSARAIADNRGMLVRYAYPAIGDLKAGDITKSRIVALLDDVAASTDARQKKGAGRSLTHRPNRVFETVRAVFRWAHGRDMIEADPTHNLKRPIENEDARERVLSDDELKRAWEGLQNAKRRGPALALILALLTGQRIGECGGIAKADVDLSDVAPGMTIQAADAKNRTTHRVPLSPAAVAILKEADRLSGRSPWMFPAPDAARAIDTDYLSTFWHDMRDGLGLGDVRAHDFRRTCATNLAQLRVARHVIGAVLNHKSVTASTITGKAYDRYQYDAEKREALTLWADKLASIVAGKNNVVSLEARRAAG
jgi:integrase